MSTDYHTAPSQHAFFTASSQHDHVDPWVISTNNVDWAKAGTRHMVHSLSVFDDEGGSWGSNTSSSIFAALKKGTTSPTHFLNIGVLDPWAHQHDSEEDENTSDGDSADDSSGDDDSQLGLYKTELCRSFIETGTCRYGLKCQFAHGANELRIVHRHPKYKTEICKTFHTQGTCPYGTRCRFIHTRSNSFSSLPCSASSSKKNSPSTSPYSSPPLTSALSRSRSPSPTAFGSQWTSNWPQSTTPKKEASAIPIPHAAARSEEGDGKNESEAPRSPSPSKKRLAIFRTISKDNLKD